MFIEQNRLTEIAFENEHGEKDYVGTGYVIGPGLILTAGHVVFGDGGVVPADLRIFVRVHSDFERVLQMGLDEFQGVRGLKLIEQALGKYGDQLRPADLIWPPPGKPSNYFDLALLSVSSSGASDSYHKFSGVALRPMSPLGELACSTGGYPTWRTVLSGAFKSSTFIVRNGNLTPTNLPFTTDLNLADDGPAAAEEWKGMSGGPVCINVADTPTLIGVVKTVENSKDNRLLSIVTFPPYVSIKGGPDPYGFWRAANRAGQVDSAVEGVTAKPVGRSSVTDYIHIVDRRPHDERIEMACDDRYKKGSQKPAVILLHGRRVDDPTSYLARWRSGDLDYKRLTGNVVQSNSGYLNWPSYSPGAIEQRFQRLRSAIVGSSIEPPASTATGNPNSPLTLGSDDPPARFQDYFKAGRLPRTFSIFLEAAQFKDEDFELLSRLLDFFAAIAAVPDVVTLFITFVYRAPPEVSYIDIEPDSDPRTEAAAKVWAGIKECVGRYESRLHVWNAGALTEVDSVTDIEDWRLKLQRKNVCPTEGFFTTLKSQFLAKETVPLLDFTGLVASSLGAS